MGIGKSKTQLWVGNWPRSSTEKMSREPRRLQWVPSVRQVQEGQVPVRENNQQVLPLDLHNQVGRSTLPGQSARCMWQVGDTHHWKCDMHQGSDMTSHPQNIQGDKVHNGDHHGC